MYKLDEVDDPSVVRYKQYNGDFFYDFELDVKWEKKKVVTDSKENPVKYEIEFGDLDKIRSWHSFLDTRSSETGTFMMRNVLKWAFPHLFEYYYENMDELETRTKEQNEEELKKALAKELEYFTGLDPLEPPPDTIDLSGWN